MTPPGITDDLKLLQATIEQAFNAVVVTDADLSHGGPLIVYCNPAFCRMTGYRMEELLGRSPRILQGPATDPAVIDELRRCLAEGDFFQGSTVNYRKDGEPYHVEWNISPIRNPAGSIRHFVSVQQNITQRVQAEQMRDLLAQALNVSSDPILITDHEAVIRFVNRAFEGLTGYTPEEVLGHTPKLFQSGQHDADFYRDLRSALAAGRNFRAVFTNRRKDGSEFFADQSITPLLDAAGHVNHYVSISKDITESVKETQALSEQARTDELTGLLNRRAGDETMAKLVTSARLGGPGFCILLGDIDHFKRVNDDFGHLAGDRVLEGIAIRLQAAARDSDSLVRWGGEEFLIILPDTGFAGGSAAARRIQASLADWADPEVGSVTMSWGLTAWRPEDSASTVIERADELLYRAKQRGRNRVEFEQDDFGQNSVH